MIGKLVEAEDPKAIRAILREEGVNIEDLSPDQPSDQPTLRELYQRYLSRRRNRRPATRAQYKRTIPDFLEAAAEAGIITPDQLTLEMVERYVDELLAEYDSDATILTHSKNVRAWLSWLETRRYVEEYIYQVLNKGELELDPEARDEAPSTHEMLGVLNTLRRKRRGTHLHAALELLWNSALRLGGLHSLDVGDLEPANGMLVVRNRPDTGTYLKNGDESDSTRGDGERDIAISQRTVDALLAYLNDSDRPVTDDHGRRPLFCTDEGRASPGTLRRWIYQATSCRWASEHVHGPSCDGSCHPDTDVCPYSYYPHAIRRGAIVDQVSGGLRHDRASERFDVSIKIIKKHYDPRVKRRESNDREENVRNSWST